MSPPKKKPRCDVNFGGNNCGIKEEPSSKYSGFGCKIDGGYWKEIVTYDNAIEFGDDYTKYHRLLDNRVFIHRLFQDGKDHKIEWKDSSSKILGYFIYSFRLVSYHGSEPLRINGPAGKGKVKLQKLLKPMKIRLLLLRICDHEIIKKTNIDIKDIVSDIKDFNGSKVDDRFEIIEDETKVVKCSEECSFTISETVNFCIDFNGIKDCIVDDDDDNYDFGIERDLTVGNIGISAFYDNLFIIMAELYQNDYGQAASTTKLTKDIVKQQNYNKDKTHNIVNLINAAIQNIDEYKMITGKKPNENYLSYNDIREKMIKETNVNRLQDNGYWSKIIRNNKFPELQKLRRAILKSKQKDEIKTESQTIKQEPNNEIKIKKEEIENSEFKGNFKQPKQEVKLPVDEKVEFDNEQNTKDIKQKAELLVVNEIDYYESEQKVELLMVNEDKVVEFDNEQNMKDIEKAKSLV
ncbi:2158_t:CDS:2, partial [Paraglomus occultum]